MSEPRAKCSADANFADRGAPKTVFVTERVYGTPYGQERLVRIKARQRRETQDGPKFWYTHQLIPRSLAPVPTTTISSMVHVGTVSGNRLWSILAPEDLAVICQLSLRRDDSESKALVPLTNGCQYPGTGLRERPV